MNLQEYITDLSAKLRGTEEVVIDAANPHYRNLMAMVLTTNLTGPTAAVIDGLVAEAFNLSHAYNHANAKLTELQQKVDANGVPVAVKKERKNAIKKG